MTEAAMMDCSLRVRFRHGYAGSSGRNPSTQRPLYGHLAGRWTWLRKSAASKRDLLGEQAAVVSQSGVAVSCDFGIHRHGFVEKCLVCKVRSATAAHIS